MSSAWTLPYSRAAQLDQLSLGDQEQGRRKAIGAVFNLPEDDEPTKTEVSLPVTF